MTLTKRFMMLLFSLFLLILLIVGDDSTKQTNLSSIQYVSGCPDPIEIEQPDGMPLMIMLIGDEFMHYAQTTDGYTILQNEEGYYHYARINIDGDMVSSNVRASNPENRGRNETIFLRTISPGLRYSEAQIINSQYRRIEPLEGNIEFDGITGTFPTTGTRNFLVILINFTDKAFVKFNAQFDGLYNTNGISFKNYYLSTSYNQLTLNTTVVGPFNIAGNMATYGANDAYGNDINPRLMVQQAVDAAENAGVNFALYDNDGNGVVDGIQVVHAGYGEEAGAPSTTIWSHQWTLGTMSRTYDGVVINSYSTVPELSGTSGTTMTGVGVLVHEFGHILGCPDTYDTDYSYSGGQSWDCKVWDVMAGGSWNNNGNNPPIHNPYFRWRLGWLTPITLTSGGNLSLNYATASSTVYRYDTTTTNEYFLLENRQQVGDWDGYLPGHGMLIWHIDGPWIASHTSNNINVTPTHQGIDIEEADNVKTTATYGGDTFPGTAGKTSFTDNTTPNSKSWAGANTTKPISNILESNGVISFKFTYGSMSVYISGPTQGNNSGTYTWYANVSGTYLQPPYTYDWRYSLDDYDYTSSFGTTQSVTAQLPYSLDLYLKVTVHDASGKVATATFHTINTDNNGEEPY